MIRLIVFALAAAGTAVVVRATVPDIRRYVTMSRM